VVNENDRHYKFKTDGDFWIIMAQIANQCQLRNYSRVAEIEFS